MNVLVATGAAPFARPLPCGLSPDIPLLRNNFYHIAVSLALVPFRASFPGVTATPVIWVGPLRGAGGIFCLFQPAALFMQFACQFLGRLFDAVNWDFLGLAQPAMPVIPANLAAYEFADCNFFPRLQFSGLSGNIATKKGRLSAGPEFSL